MRRLLGLFAVGWPLALFAAPARVLVETALVESTVPVNAQATYTVRVLQAVDLQVPVLPPPRVRLAEVRPLGGNERRELVRDGVRYRVHERRFAVLPFASGRLDIGGEVALSSALRLPEFGQQASGALRYPPQTLTVTPAEAGAHWLPAWSVQLRDVSTPPAALARGDWWRREIVIEAEGVEGSAIPAPDWTTDPAWTPSSESPQFSSRIAEQRLVGIRRQVFRWRAEQGGEQTAPSASLHWWDRQGNRWRTATLPGPTFRVSGDAAGATPVAVEESSGAPGRRLPLAGWLLMLAAGIAVLAVSGWRYRRSLREFFRRRRASRQLVAACRMRDPRAAQRAVVEWACAAGWPETTLGAIRQRWRQQLAEAGRTDDSVRLDDALRQLERACYGASAAAWDGMPLAALWRRLPRRAAAMRVSSAPSCRSCPSTPLRSPS